MGGTWRVEAVPVACALVGVADVHHCLQLLVLIAQTRAAAAPASP